VSVGIRDVLLAAGRDVVTVREEGLQGISDASLYETCRREHRCLVTLALDFSDVTRFPPESTSGLLVLRPGREITLGVLRHLAERLAVAVHEQPIGGQLLIVEPGRIRIGVSKKESDWLVTLHMRQSPSLTL